MYVRWAVIENEEFLRESLHFRTSVIVYFIHKPTFYFVIEAIDSWKIFYPQPPQTQNFIYEFNWIQNVMRVPYEFKCFRTS